MSSTLTSNLDPAASVDASTPGGTGLAGGAATSAATGDAAQTGGVALLELKNLTKQFGATVALRDINLTLDAGRFHALLGENGAGKSTIIKILAGIYRPTRGEVLWEGSRVDHPTPALLRSLGLHIVHQDSSVLPGLTVAQNFALGQASSSIRRCRPSACRSATARSSRS